MNLSQEEILLQKILFDSSHNVKNSNKINFEKLIKISSEHLMLPSLFINIYRKKIKEKFPSDFITYINEIFEINKNRNEILLCEALEISELLNLNSIDHVFLKGTALISKNIYLDAGERMINDIDFLIRKEDKIKFKECIYSSGYSENYPNKITYNHRHLPRLVNEHKLFAIEPHLNLLEKKGLLTESDFLNDIENHGAINTSNLINNLLLNIYSFQVNDFGSLRLNYSYRNIYDSYLMIKRINFDKISKIRNKEITLYFMILNELGIKNLNEYRTNESNMLKILFRLIKSSKIIRFFYNLSLEIFLSSKRLVLLIIEFLFNRKYRFYILRKIFSKN